MKRLFSLLTIVFILVSAPISVSASNIQGEIWLRIHDITDKACYIDLLIKMDKNDDRYTEKNAENMKQFSFDTEKLCSYNDNGFISFSCHVKRNLTRAVLEKNSAHESTNRFSCKLDDMRTSLGWGIINDDYEFKVIVLDENGEILQTSEIFDLNDMKKDEGYIEYNVKANTVKLDLPYKSDRSFAKLLNILFNAVPIIALIVFVGGIGFLIIWYIRHRT
ncbi:MAG: hypothetical protein IJ871_08535 [Ruminococcus sp.]|nr:hypothetical protein [Ruminococcus sp.]